MTTSGVPVSPYQSIRSEIASRQRLAQVSGLSRTAPAEFLGVVGRIAALQDARAVHALPAPRAESIERSVEAEIVDDDGNALAGFDRENRI
jgi:hypothetical protein